MNSLTVGATNRLVLRVVDHTGAGGLHRKAFITTGEPDPERRDDLLN